jgi:hypothetical protein
VGGFLFRLETIDGVAADPPTLEAAVPNWKAGDSIYFGYKTLRVVGTRDDDADQPPVLSFTTARGSSLRASTQRGLQTRCAAADA